MQSMNRRMNADAAELFPYGEEKNTVCLGEPSFWTVLFYCMGKWRKAARGERGAAS